MKGMRFIVAIVGATLFFGVFSAQSVHAQSSEVKAARDTVQRTVEKATNDDSRQTAAADTIADRRAAIMSILDLTNSELADLLASERLGAIVARGDAVMALSAAQLTSRLIAYRGYVQLVSAQTTSSGATLESLQSIAGDLKNWRENVYDPAVRQAFDALLVFQGGDVLQTAMQRLSKINIDIKKLQSSKGVQAVQFLPLLESARGHMLSAARHQEDARGMFKDNQDRFLRIAYGELPGAPQAISLRRGPDGDFACLPGQAASVKQCEIGFSLSAGGYYALRTAQGDPVPYRAADLSRVQGTLITVRSIFSSEAILGVIFVNQFNSPDALDLSSGKSIDISDYLGAFSGSASATDALLKPVTIQSLIKQEIAEINLAYQDFFAMSKLAKRLLSQ